MAALPVFEAELVNRRHWFTPAEVAEAYAISQSIPGVIIVNFAVLTGLRLSGRAVALFAALAVSMPAFVCLLLIAMYFQNQWNNRWVNAALQGLRPAILALIAASAIRLGKNMTRSPFLLLATLTGTVLLLAKILSPVFLILIGITSGLAFHHLFKMRKSRP